MNVTIRQSVPKCVKIILIDRISFSFKQSLFKNNEYRNISYTYLHETRTQTYT